MSNLNEDKIGSILAAMDSGKKQTTICDFYELGFNTASEIKKIRDAILNKDHKEAARLIFSENLRLGNNTRKSVMKYYGYHVPEEFLPKPKMQTPVEIVKLPATKPEPQVDYRPYLQSILTQIGQMNATMTAMLQSTNDTGKLLHAMAERLEDFTPSVSRDLDLVKQGQEVITENMNTIIQQFGSNNDRVKFIAQQLKK